MVDKHLNWINDSLLQAPSSASSAHQIKDEEEPLFGEGVIIKEENVSPVDFVERKNNWLQRGGKKG